MLVALAALAAAFATPFAAAFAAMAAAVAAATNVNKARRSGMRARLRRKGRRVSLLLVRCKLIIFRILITAAHAYRSSRHAQHVHGCGATCKTELDI